MLRRDHALPRSCRLCLCPVAARLFKSACAASARPLQINRNNWVQKRSCSRPDSKTRTASRLEGSSKLRRVKTRKEDVPSACWARFAAARLVRRAAIVRAVGSSGVTTTCFAVCRMLCELAQLGGRFCRPGHLRVWSCDAIDGSRNLALPLAVGGRRTGQFAGTVHMGLAMVARTVPAPSHHLQGWDA